MSIQYAGGTYVDQSQLFGANSIVDYLTLLTSGLASAGWTVTTGKSYNLFGQVPPGFGQTNPANNNTVTINGRTYTYKNTLTGAADEILIGANVMATLFNTKAAWNAEAGAGTLYGTGTTVNADIAALALLVLNSGTSATVIVESKSAAAVTVSKSGNLAWYNTTTTAKTLYKFVSAETSAFQKITMYAAEDVNSTANTLFMYVASRDLQNGTGRNTTINTVSGDTMRLLAHRYGFHTFETGAFGVNSTGNFVQVPYVPAFLAPKKITAATNASPIVITTSAAHGYTSGDTVFIKYVEGNLAANGTFSITVLSPTTFSLNASAGSGAFSGTLGLVANQTPPYIEILENTWISFGLTTGAGWNTNYSSYGLGTAAFGGIFDGVVLQNTANCSFLFPRAVNTGGTAFNWVSGAGVALEPLVLYTSLYGGAPRCAGQIYNAWWSQQNTVGGAINTADSHTWYGVYNNDANGQLFLLTS